MKVTFLYGRSGSGKTRTIANHLRRSTEDGIHSFLLIPEQQSHSAERHMLNLLPPSAQLTVEALSFSRLSNRVFRQYGGLSYRYATSGIRTLLMWRNLCELSPLLAQYGEQAAQNPTLSELMLSAVNELKGCGVSSATLERAAKRLPDSHTLRTRLSDIALIYAAYQNALTERYDDAADDLARLDEVLEKHDFFKNCHVYIDYFTSFTAREIAVIRHIFRQAAHVTVALGCEGRADRSLHLATVTDTANTLYRLAIDCGCTVEEICLQGNHRAQSGALAAFERDLWRLEKNTPSENVSADDHSIRLMRCADPYEEADAAAALICQKVQNGARWRDFVIICRDTQQYDGILDAALEKHHIPAFYAEKTDLSSLPLIKLILTAMRIICHNWRQSDVITHLKTGLCPYSDEDLDDFESYVKTWRLRGRDFLRDRWQMNPDGYVADNRMSARAVRILEAANRVRAALVPPLLTLEEEMKSAGNVPEMCRALYRYLEVLNVKEQLRQSAIRDFSYGDSGKSRAEATLRLYGTVLDVLDQMADALPEQQMTPEEFSTALKLMFDRTQLAAIPDTVDQVLIGSASMLRTDEPRFAILLGLSEGVFPRAVQDEGIFSDSDKKLLETVGVKLSGGNTMRASDELYFVYRAITAPSECLILLAPNADCDGKHRQPSLPFERAKKLFPHLQEEIYAALPLTSRLWNREMALEALPDITDEDTRRTLQTVLQQDPSCARRLETLRIPVSDPDCTVAPETARMVFPRHLSLTQSKLDRYVLCHFHYYCSYVLNLKQEEVARFRTKDIGTLIHAIMEAFFRRVTAQEPDSTHFADSLTEGECEVIVDDILQAYLREICPEGQLPSNRLLHLITRLRNLSLLLIENLREEFRHSTFVPAFFELNIRPRGSRDDAPSTLDIHLGNGETASMGGIIDRVDVYRKDGNVYLRVVDYKTGSKDFSLEDVRQGLNVQLLLYLFTLLKNSPETFKELMGMQKGGTLFPAGVMYLTANIPPITVDEDLSREEIRELAKGRLLRRGLLLNDPEILTAMNDQLDPAFLGEVKRSRAKNKEDGGISGKALIDLDAFQAIGEELEQTIRGIATSMKRGDAQARPLVHKNQDACQYCDMRAICRSATTQKANR